VNKDEHTSAKEETKDADENMITFSTASFVCLFPCYQD